MSIDSIVSISLFVLGTGLIGAGVGAKDPAWAAVAVGGILLALVVGSTFRRSRTG